MEVTTTDVTKAGEVTTEETITDVMADGVVLVVTTTDVTEDGVALVETTTKKFSIFHFNPVFSISKHPINFQIKSNNHILITLQILLLIYKHIQL
jgi:hypothetical protein